MPEHQLTYEGVLELIREANREIGLETSRWLKEQGAEFDRRMKEQAADYDRRMKDYDRRSKETDRKISALGSRIGEIVENMVGGRVVDKFKALGYEIVRITRNHSFQNHKLGVGGEFDLVLHDGDVSIFIEVKTTLETADVRRHIERMEQYRSHADAMGNAAMRFIGAVAGAVVKDDAVNFAHANGLYTIVQSGEAVEIVPPPEGFRAKEW